MTVPQPLRRVEKWKTESRFPTFPLVVFASQIQSRKESLAADRSAPAFRLILQREYARGVFAAAKSIHLLMTDCESGALLNSR
jgi:hypothetical protein